MSNMTLSLMAEFWQFIRERKKWWLAPVIFLMLILAALIFLTQGSAISPFIYTIF